MKKILISTIAVSALLFTVSCKTDFDTDVNDIVVSKGDADFSKYVSLGNSLTSGYRDNALYLDGQNESYPSMIAQQMRLAGGGAFVQPMVSDNNGGLKIGSNIIAATKVYLKGFDSFGSPILENVTTPPTTDITQKVTGPLNNYGVPGAKTAHLIAPGYGNIAGLPATANPYYVRFATSTTSTILGDALAQNPTFVSLWIGNNDVLGYATTGGDGTNPITPNAGAVGIGFDNTYAYLVDTIFPNNTARKGIVANIPYVTSIPFFTTVPYKPVPGAKIAANVAALNGLYDQLKSALAYLGVNDRIVESLSGTTTNRVLLSDESLPNLSTQLTAVFTASGMPAAQAAAFGQIYGQARQSRPTDMILLTTGKDIGTVAAGAPAQINVYGLSYPLQDKHILIPTEAAEIKTAVDAMNVKIKAVAAAKGLAFVDANAKMLELSANSGIQYDAVKYSAKFITGGTFSLDGVHLTGRGYALIANEFLRVINAKYHSTLPMVNVNSYSGVTFP
jgi:hypothetical protein